MTSLTASAAAEGPTRDLEPQSREARRQLRDHRFYKRTQLACLVVVGGVALALAICVFSLPNVLGGVHAYDDGVYLAAPTRLLQGALPYRDFAYLHPPGGPLLFLPLGLVAHLFSEQSAMVVARMVTGGAWVADAVLGAFVLRARGRAAMLAGGLCLACFPLAVTAYGSLLLDPFMVLLILLGMAALIDGSGGVTVSRRRLLLGGIALGFACAVKLWAVLPIAAVLVVCLWLNSVRRSRPVLLGIILGVGIPTLLALAIAPVQFVHEVVVTQVVRTPPNGTTWSVGSRISSITGLDGLGNIHVSSDTSIAALIALAALTVVVFLYPVRRLPLDWMILLATILVVPAMLIVREFYVSYAWFPSVMLALLIGVDVGRVTAILRRLPFRSIGGAGRGAATWLVALAVSAVCVAIVLPKDEAYARGYLSNASNPGPELAQYISPGACVVFDEATLAINANRLISSASCPPLVDPFGQWLVDEPENPPPSSGPYTDDLVRFWTQTLQQADYLIEVAPQSDFIPWTASVSAYVGAHFVLVHSQPGAYLYERKSSLYRLSASTTVPTSAAPSSSSLVSDGLATEQMGRTSQAFADFKAAEQADAGNKYAHYDMGYIYQQRGDAHDAAIEYRRTLAIDPAFAQALYNLGVLEATSNPSQAISYYLDDLRLEPNDAAANFNLGVLLIEHGQRSQGQIYLAKGLKLEPSLFARIPPGIF